MATTLLSAQTTTVTTTTTLLYQSSGSIKHTGNKNNPLPGLPSPQERFTDRFTPSNGNEKSFEKLKDAAKNYLDTLNTIGRALGFRENDKFANIARSIVGGSSETADSNTLVHHKFELSVSKVSLRAESHSTPRSHIRSGSGDDFINTLGKVRINSGGGDDVINTLGKARIKAGSGDDIITALGRSKIKAGSGDDIISAFGHSHIRAGSGDDVINASGHSRINAGSGDDVINVYGSSHINAGAGDDIILAGGEGAVIEFGKGSGSDTVFAATDVAINIGPGLTEESLTVTYDAGRATISFEGSDDELTLYFDEGSNVRLNFENGQSLDLTPTLDISA